VGAALATLALALVAAGGWLAVALHQLRIARSRLRLARADAGRLRAALQGAQARARMLREETHLLAAPEAVARGVAALHASLARELEGRDEPPG